MIRRGRSLPVGRPTVGARGPRPLRWFRPVLTSSRRSPAARHAAGVRTRSGPTSAGVTCGCRERPTAAPPGRPRSLSTVRAGPRGDQTPRLLILPNGTLLTVFARGDEQRGVGELYATRSRDDGRTWRPAVRFFSKRLQSFRDDKGTELPIPQYPSAAVAPDGTVYVTV